MNLRERIWKRDQGLCFYCGCNLSRKNRTLDHVIPRCKEGTSNRMWNLVLSCRGCNAAKNDSDPDGELLALVMHRKTLSETHQAIGRAIGRAKVEGHTEDVTILLGLLHAVWFALHQPVKS